MNTLFEQARIHFHTSLWCTFVSSLLNLQMSCITISPHKIPGGKSDWHDREDRYSKKRIQTLEGLEERALGETDVEKKQSMISTENFTYWNTFHLYSLGSWQPLWHTQVCVAHGFEWIILIQEWASQHTNSDAAKLITANKQYWLTFSWNFLVDNAKHSFTLSTAKIST